MGWGDKHEKRPHEVAFKVQIIGLDALFGWFWLAAQQLELLGVEAEGELEFAVAVYPWVARYASFDENHPPFGHMFESDVR